MDDRATIPIDLADRGETRGPSRALPRLAGDHDEFVSSPVHELQENLGAFIDLAPEPVMQFYPGWVQLVVLVAGSAALWALIFGVVNLVRQG